MGAVRHNVSRGTALCWPFFSASKARLGPQALPQINSWVRRRHFPCWPGGGYNDVRCLSRLPCGHFVALTGKRHRCWSRAGQQGFLWLPHGNPRFTALAQPVPVCGRSADRSIKCSQAVLAHPKTAGLRQWLQHRQRRATVKAVLDSRRHRHTELTRNRHRTRGRKGSGHVCTHRQ